MDQTLRQLGDLLLGSIPTIIFFVLTFAAYRLLLHGPLESVLQQRHARTLGAMQKAQADVSAAQAKTSEYEQRLREARMRVFKAQELRRNKVLEARSAALAEARERSMRLVQEARASLQQEAGAARASLQGEAERLSTDIIEAILKPVRLAQSHSPAGGAR